MERRPVIRRILTFAIAVASATALTATAPASAAPASAAAPTKAPADTKPRTVVTTDGEQDDVDSMIRYLAYADDFDTVGLVYTASVWHWAGDGKGTPFMSPDPHGQYTTPQTTWRWTGTQWLQDLIGAYAQEYPNFHTHDPNYPTPASLSRAVAIGNIDFEGEMDHDTAGSNLIKKLLLDNEPGPLYLQAWGGMNTIARALKSIQDEYQGTPRWPSVYAKVSAKAVIEASGFQDDTYTTYIAPTWPRIQVDDRETGYNVWGYPRTKNTLQQDQVYYTGAWMKANIVDAGPLGAQEYTYGDGRWNGDPGYTQWKGTAQPKYTFVSEGDNVAFLPLIDTGLRDVDPTYGGWGGRLRQQTISPNLFTNVPSDTYTDGTPMANYDWSRWFQTEQLDFAQRMLWGVTPKYGDAEHEPVVHLLGAHTVSVRPGGSVRLHGLGYDPDGRQLSAQWWQYRDAGTYAGLVDIGSPNAYATTVTVPPDARTGQTIHVILQVTENGPHSLTRYQRVVITVR